jgi:CheY-like chemotaxis protein
MGGELKLESEVGKGSEFYFQLEFEVGEDTTEEYFTDAEDLSRLRVLILDDTDSNRIIFKKYFSYWGIHCDEASDVNEAVAKVKKAIENHTNYNLILADFQMPDQTGFDFGDILIKENLKRNTRLILFSSISDMIDAKTIYKHGFDAYLYKPVKYHPFRKIVFETINKQVEYKLKDSGIIEEAKQEEEVKENLEIKILLAEDNLINQKVATVTLSKLGYNNVDVANNGTEAVQMHLKNHYDLILMDIQMPVMNGLDATEKIRESERANPDAKRVKIVALTANALASDVKMYLQRGMDDVLTKPFKPNDLKRVLQ